VHITELGGEYWRFDDVRQELRGDRSGMRYGVGSRVQVQVSRVDLDARKIDFRLVAPDESERLLAKGRSARQVGAPAPASAQSELAGLASADRAAKAVTKRVRRAASEAAKRTTPAGAKRPTAKKRARR
jgi:ribonuclease R